MALRCVGFQEGRVILEGFSASATYARCGICTVSSRDLLGQVKVWYVLLILPSAAGNKAPAAIEAGPCDVGVQHAFRTQARAKEGGMTNCL